MLPSVIKRVFFFCGSKTVAATMFLLKYLALFKKYQIISTK